MTTIQFKSKRAAQIAVTKATAAYEQACNEYASLRETGMGVDSTWPIYRAAVSDACDRMRALYDAAAAQGYSTRCWYLNHNPTRDLIAANID